MVEDNENNCEDEQGDSSELEVELSCDFRIPVSQFEETGISYEEIKKQCKMWKKAQEKIWEGAIGERTPEKERMSEEGHAEAKIVQAFIDFVVKKGIFDPTNPSTYGPCQFAVLEMNLSNSE